MKTMKKSIELHLLMLGEVLRTTERIHELAIVSKINELLFEVDNRERLISIVGKIQKEIEAMIDNLSGDEVGIEILQGLQEWKSSTVLKLREIKFIDEKIVDLITRDKDKISKELSIVFQNRESFKGYNLNNTK